MTWWERLFGGQKRLDELARRGRTMDLQRVLEGPPSRIFRVDMGFGFEYWTAGPGELTLEDDFPAVAGGMLVVSDGRRVTSSDVFRSHGFEIEEVVIDE